MLSDVTVFIACYSKTNKEFLDETVESIREQGIEPIVDYSEAWTGERWSDAIEKCSTKYLHLAHHDDVYMPGFYEQTIAYLDAHPTAPAVFTLDYIIDEKGKRIGQTTLPFMPQDSYDYAFILNNMAKYGNFLRCPSVVFNVENVKGLRYPVIGTAGDTAFWYTIMERGSIGIIPKPLFKYRQHSQSDTQANVVVSVGPSDHYYAMEYALNRHPEYATWDVLVPLSGIIKENHRRAEEAKCKKQAESAKRVTFIVVHESPDNAGTGVLAAQRVRERNAQDTEQITYYVYPITEEGAIRVLYEKGCPVISCHTNTFRQVVEKMLPDEIEYHHLLRWPLDILEAPCPAKTIYLHDSFLWCAAFHSFNGKEVCNEPEELKCLACVRIPVEAFRKKKEYLTRVLKDMRVVANSDYTAMYAGLHLGCKVDVHTFDIPPLSKPFKGKRVGYFGGWYPVKGIDTLMEVARLMPDVQFLLFTNPPEGLLYGRRIHGYENILVLGGYNRMDIPCLSNLVDVVIVPSRNESFGMVARELRSMDVPVVASRVGGLDGNVDPNDVQGFVKALREIL